MAEMEKITINMGVVDLGQVDLLVEQGFYSSRTEFVRAAVRRQLEQHGEVVRQMVSVKTLTVGVARLSRRELERDVAAGKKLTLRVVGMLVIDSDVTPELALQGIEALRVYGTLRAPAAVTRALSARME